MPAMLMSGLRIEIVWEDTVKALFSDAANPTKCPKSYTITDPQMCLSSVQLSDSIQRALNELSATNGLEIVYCDYERDMHTSGDSLSTLNMEIRKACSRALKAFARIRVTGGDGITSDDRRDIFKAETGFPAYEYQWRLGSLYFPQQPVRSEASAPGAQKNAITAYANLLESVDKYHGGAKAPYVSLYGTDKEPVEYKAFNTTKDGKKGSFTGDAHTIGVTLERSTMFNLAGIPVNNSRVLALNAKLLPDTKEPVSAASANLVTNPVRQVDVFLKYVRLARVFLNNVEVEQ
jgi:hypothetical protein